MGETRKLKGELTKIIPKPKILIENERKLSKEKMSDIVPKNTLKEQPGKEMTIGEKETVVQLGECTKFYRYTINKIGGISERAAQITFHIHRERKHQPTPYKHHVATRPLNPRRG